MHRRPEITPTSSPPSLSSFSLLSSAHLPLVKNLGSMILQQWNVSQDVLFVCL